MAHLIGNAPLIGPAVDRLDIMRAAAIPVVAHLPAVWRGEFAQQVGQQMVRAVQGNEIIAVEGSTTGWSRSMRWWPWDGSRIARPFSEGVPDGSAIASAPQDSEHFRLAPRTWAPLDGHI